MYKIINGKIFKKGKIYTKNKYCSIFLVILLSFVFILPQNTLAESNYFLKNDTSTSYGHYYVKAVSSISNPVYTYNGAFSVNTTTYKSVVVWNYQFNNIYSGTITIKFNKNTCVNNYYNLDFVGTSASVQQVNTSNYSYTIRLNEVMAFTLIMPSTDNITSSTGLSVSSVSDSLTTIVPDATRLTQLYNQLSTANSTLSSILTALHNQGGNGGSSTINFKQWYRDYSLSSNGFMDSYTKANAWLNSNGQYITQSALSNKSDTYYGYEYTFSGWNTRDITYTHARSFAIQPNTTQYFVFMSSIQMYVPADNLRYPILYGFYTGDVAPTDFFRLNNQQWDIIYNMRMGDYILHTIVVPNKTDKQLNISIDFVRPSFRIVPLYLGSNYNLPTILEQITKLDTEDKYTKLLSDLIVAVNSIDINYSQNITNQEITNNTNIFNDNQNIINNIQNHFSLDFDNQKQDVDTSLQTLDNVPIFQDLQNATNFTNGVFGRLFGAVPWLEWVLILVLFLALVLAILG